MSAIEGAVMTFAWQRLKETQIVPRVKAFLELNELKLRLSIKHTDAGLAELYELVRTGSKLMPSLDSYPDIKKIKEANDIARDDSDRLQLISIAAKASADPTSNGVSIMDDVCRDLDRTSLAVMKKASGMSDAMGKIASSLMSHATSCR